MSNETKNNNAVTVAGTINRATIPFVGRSARASDATRFGDGLAFLRGFLARPLEVASVVPSSPFLEARVVRAADLAQARCVVELGPGTGGTTRVQPSYLTRTHLPAQDLVSPSSRSACGPLRGRALAAG